ncbi:hypothetical protein LCGC14_0586990 [marine sediment metagenome]|uniref:Uncharacterized protein n=1 Tax=marine sediment metagenome TaxID=412755 RepID=A0A0F9RYH5_9ZZZZ|nr:hypothetical protein [archaeon]HEC36994.1 hypothetical protein [bacterium]
MRANSRSLVGNVPQYVIYALMQKRDLYTGIPLSKPILEVGYKTNPRSMKKILTDHRVTLLYSLKGPSNVYFRIAYFTSLQEEGVIPQNARFHDYFEAVPIDMAATVKQMKNLERFWTIYLNRMDGRDAYSLEYNNFFNAIVGDKFDGQRVRNVVDEIRYVSVELDEQKYYIYVSKENLDSFIGLGFDKKDLMWYFREGQKSINKIVSYYYADRNFRDIQKEIITNRLIQLATEGIPYSELINYFYKCNDRRVFIVSNYKDSSFTPEITQYTVDKLYERVMKYVGGVNAYNDIFFDNYLKPYLLEMQAQGLITKETVISILKGELAIPPLDYRSATGMPATSFRWLFQELFGPDIISVLASKDYGVGFVPFQLLKDLNVYVQDDFNFNNRMASHLRTIIDLMFETTDLSEIYRRLNAGTL